MNGNCARVGFDQVAIVSNISSSTKILSLTKTFTYNKYHIIFTKKVRRLKILLYK